MRIQPNGKNRAIFAQNFFQGGVGDDFSAENIDAAQIIAGIAVESEHTENWQQALEIAKDHLAEDPQYYTTIIPKDEIISALSRVAKEVGKKEDSNENQT